MSTTMTNNGFTNLAESAYHALDAASNSTLGYMKRSPAHCKAYMEDDFEQTPSMLLGSVVHKLVLEPETFDNSYVALPAGIDKRTKAGKEAWNKLEATLNGRTLIKAELVEHAQLVADSVRSHETAGEYLHTGQAEVSCLWQDQEHNFPCKSRFDFLNSDDVIVDLKTTQDASPDEFVKSIYKYGYYRQAAMYCDGFENVTGRKAKGFVFIAVETKAPYAVGVYKLDANSLMLGREEYRELLGQFVQCKRNDLWPAYPEQLQEISLPAWVMDKHEQKVTEGIL